MKTILTLSVLVALVCGCRQTTSQPKLTPEDVAWATGTRIAKWDLRTLTSKPVYAVGLVLLGATNEVLSQFGLIDGFQTPFSSAGGSEVRVALQRNMLQFGCGGSSSESKLDPSLELRFWYGSTLAPVRDLVPIASDASHSSDQPDAILASRSKKLCLRIYTEPFLPGKPTGAAKEKESQGPLQLPVASSGL
jgi:hypothetical protein